MKVTIYELLGMIKDSKTPKNARIRYFDRKNDYEDECILNEVAIGFGLYNQNIELNDEVEIIEEPQEHTIPEKLDLGDYTEITSKNDMEYKMFEYIFNKNANAFYNKINEILDYLEGIK
jgi:hypothetical protein